MQSVRADFTRWVGNDGLWHIDTNWNPAVLPGANDPVLVDQGLFTATHDATSGQSTVAQVILENKMTVVLSGGTLSILGGDDPDQYFTSLGVFGQSRYMQTGGLLEAPLGIDVSGKSVVDIGGGEVTGQGLTAGINIATQSGYLQSGGTNHLSLSLGGGTALLTNGSLGDTTTSSVRVLFNGTFTQQGGVVTAHSLNVDSGGYYEMTDGAINVSTILIGKTNPAGATTSTGTLVQSAGTVSVNHTLAVMGGQYLLNAATLNASSAVHIGTDLPGVPSDALLDNNGGTIVLDDSASGVIGNGTLRHRGTLVKTGVNGGQPQVATTFITSGGTIDVQNGGVALTGNLYANAPLIGTESLVKTGPGVLTLTGAQDWQPGTSLALLGGDTVVTTDLGAGTARPDVRVNNATLTVSTIQSLNTLQLETSAAVRLLQGSAATLIVGTLSVDADNGAKLDLADNSAMFSSTSQALLQSLILRARNGGAWDQPGVTSSTAATETTPNIRTLAVLGGNEYITLNGPGATFNTYSVGATDVLVKYTYYGDTDFNGIVNFDDYARIDAGFNSALTGWLNGDLDYNDVVNFDDYALIDLAFNSQAQTLARAVSYLNGDDRSSDGMDTPALRFVEAHFVQFGDVYAQQFLNSVPEPAGAVGIAAAVCAHVMRRRRRIS